MLEHTKFMLENWYITDFFAEGSWICALVALVSSFIVLFRVNKGIQSEDEKLIRNCEFLAYYSLIGYCILAILNFIILPYSVPIYDRHGLTCNRLMVGSDLVLILLAFVYIRNVIKKLAMID